MPIQQPPPNSPVPPLRRRRRRELQSPAADSSSSTDSESDDTWHTPEGGESLDEMPQKDCVLSDGEVDLESGELEMKVHSGEKRDCRICHMKLVGDDGGGGSNGGGGIELGCSCKGDLAAAHKQCAETWFKIKGNTTCEICGATAINVVGERTNYSNATAGAAVVFATATSALPVYMPPLTETQDYWPGRRLMNVLLGCLIVAFVISWLFHLDILSHHK